MPPSIPDKISCQTPQQFLTEVSTLKDVMNLEETEETWDRMERALIRFSATIKGGGHQFKGELVDVLKTLQRKMIGALNSERTRLSAAVLDCISVVAPRIGLDFEPLVSIYIPPILQLANRTNKVYVTRSQTTIALIIGFCHIPSIVPHLLTACKESKITTGRTVAIEGILRVLNKWDWSQKEMSNKVIIVEEMIRLTGRDKDASIRQLSRQLFETYKTLFPERLDEFVAPLTPVMRKYLEIKTEERGRSMTVTKQTPTGPTVVGTAKDESNALGLRVHSPSSHRIGSHPPSPASKTTRPRVVSVRTMPPPASVPIKAGTGSRPPSCPLSQDNRDNQERQRLLSSISSTLSVQSVPVTSKVFIEHRPPIRLATSQSRSVSSTVLAVTSSGPARRIRRVVSVEQTNRPDLFAMAKKAAVRTLVQTKNHPTTSERLAADPGSVFFPDTHNSGIERRGAQRVPKPSPPSASSDNKEENISENPPDPAVPKDLVSTKEAKSETKPSIFRRALSADARSDPKIKIGFQPRRGGVLQPTMSQLNKQKPPVSNAQSRSRVISHGTLKRSGTQKKDIKPNSVTEPAESIAGESGQMRIEESAVEDAISELPAVPKADDQGQIANHDLETEQENDSPRIAISESESHIQVDSSKGGASATGSTINQAEDETRSRESTPAPETPSSSVMIGKETDKQVWGNVQILPEAIQDTSDISMNTAETTTMSLKDDRLPVQTSLVEVLVTE